MEALNCVRPALAFRGRLYQGGHEGLVLPPRRADATPSQAPSGYVASLEKASSLPSATLLRDHRIGFEEVQLSKGVRTSTLRAVSGRSSSPQVFINGSVIGGAEDLELFFQTSEAGRQAAA